MGFENEAEQSLGRPCRQMTAGPSGHAISPHPSSREGHHSTARWSSRFLLFDCDLAFSCCCSLLPAPAELGAVNPDPVHDHGQPARQRHDRLFPAAAPGDLHRPGLEPGPFDGADQQDLGRLVEHDPHHLVAALRYGAGAVALARLILAGCQSKHRPDRLGVAKARRHIDGGAVGQRHHRTDTGDRHQPPAHLVVPDDGQQAAVQDGELLAQHPPDNEQRLDQHGQIGDGSRPAP